MNRKFLLAGVFLGITLGCKVVGDDSSLLAFPVLRSSESPRSITQSNIHEFSPIDQVSSQEPRSAVKPLLRRVSSIPIVSPEKRMQQLKNAAGNSSPLKNLAIQNSEQVTQVNSIAGVNPLAKTLKAVESEVVQAAQPKKRVTTQTRISDQGKKQTIQTIINPDNSTTVLTTDAATKQLVSRVTTDAQGGIIPKETWYKENPTPVSTASKKILPLRQSLVRSNQNIATDLIGANEQVASYSLDASDVVFENIYTPEKMNNSTVRYAISPLNKFLNVENLYEPATMDYSQDIMEYADSPLKQPVTTAKNVNSNNVKFENVYRAQIIEQGRNPMRAQQVAKSIEPELDYADIYNEAPSLESSLGKFTSHNPIRQNKVTDLVVYDPEQKYQQTLDFSLPEQVDTVRPQVVTNKFKGATSLALRNYQQNVQQAQKNNQSAVIEQDIAPQVSVAPEVELFDWAKNVKMPAAVKSGSGVNSFGAMQTKLALNSHGKMLEGFKNQAKVQQAKAVQQALQSKKPAPVVVARGK